MSPTTPSVDCRGLTAAEQPAYLEFARKAWGRSKDWPQAQPSFLSWLYQENPHTLGMERDLLVLVHGDRIVGAHHRMRVPWRLNGKKVIVPSLHDLAVLPEFRESSGEQKLMPPGLRIMLAALEKEAHVALFGMASVADTIYERLRVPSIKLYWMEKVRSRIRAGIEYAGSRLGLSLHAPRTLSRGAVKTADLEIARIPNPSDEEISEALSIPARASSFADWDTASFRWRFFHAIGPVNVLLLARRHGLPVGRAVISLGGKNGVYVGRVVDLLFEDPDCLQAFIAETGRVLSDAGAPAGLAVTSSGEVAKQFLAAGWSYRKNPGGSRWFSGRGIERPQDFWICGGAWDYGCDTRIGTGAS